IQRDELRRIRKPGDHRPAGISRGLDIVRSGVVASRSANDFGSLYKPYSVGGSKRNGRSVSDRFALSRAQHERSKLTLAGGAATAFPAAQLAVPITFERGDG